MKRPPGPRGRETLSFFSLKSGSQRLRFLEETARRHGPLSYFRLLHQHTFLVDDADLVKEVLVVQQHRFGRDVGATILRELLGDGLITREEPLHRERRRVLQPAFHREQIASYIDIIGQESTRTFSGWRDGASVDVGEQMRQLTLSIIGTSLFGAEFGESAREISAVLDQVMQRAARIAPAITVLKGITRQYRRRFPRGPSLLFQSQRKELDLILRPLIEARRRNSNGRDVLSLLLNVHDETSGSLTDEDILNEIVTFVLAGHETTATALTWACHLLSTHAAVQTQLAAESETVTGDAEALSRLPYTAAVFNETMRLYPPVPIFGRRVEEPVTLGGYELPVGATVLLSPFITQRNPRYYDDPEVFMPERSNAGAAPKFAFFPFGGGAKMCIGEPLARAEGVLILAEMMRRFEFCAPINGTLSFNPTITLRPDRPVVLTVRGRQLLEHSRPAVTQQHSTSEHLKEPLSR